MDHFTLNGLDKKLLPKESTLAFIRSFARNYREFPDVDCCLHVPNRMTS